MKVRKNIDPNWSAKREAGMDKALLEMSLDIHRRAGILAPFLTGALKKSGKVSKALEGYIVSFGSDRVPYAMRRHYENKKNPQTLRYLERAGDAVARSDKSKYFRGKV